MRALVFYICSSADAAAGGGDGTGTGTSGTSGASVHDPIGFRWGDSISTNVVASGACGLCAYVDEGDGPLRQFFRGLREVEGGERDTASHVMRLGQAPSAWVLGPGLASAGETTFDLERDAGVPLREGVHDVYREASMEEVGRRVSWLLEERGAEGEVVAAPGASGRPTRDAVYVLLCGGMAGLEHVLLQVGAERLDDVFLALVVERRGEEILQAVHGHAHCPFRPPQSYTFRGSVSMPIRRDLLSAVVYRGPRNPPPSGNGSTRVDGVARLDDLGLVYAEGCGSCVLAERVLFEVAYKIGWSQKFGS